MDLVQQFQQGLRESVPVWLLRLRDVAEKSVVVNGSEISRLASIMIKSALKQRLYATVTHSKENHSLTQWIMAASQLTWLNKPVISTHSGLWNTIEELQNYIWKLGRREAIYENTLESPDLVTVGMTDLILQSSFPSLWDTYSDILSFGGF